MQVTPEKQVTPQDWDARVSALTAKLPERLRHAVDWLREPARFWIRLLAAILFSYFGLQRRKWQQGGAD